MANATDFKPILTSEVIPELRLLRYNPSSSIETFFSRLEDSLDGRMEVMDPSNPFTYLLDSVVTSTHMSIMEIEELLKRRYVRMASTEDDLYKHMSDEDYIGRFSEPANATMVFNVMFTDFKRLAVWNPDTNQYVIKIPRMYTVTVGQYNFTSLYPILITQHEGGVIDVRYDGSLISDIQPLRASHVDFQLIRQFGNESWIQFRIPVKEVAIEATEYPVERSKLFRKSVRIPDGRQFYYIEVFRRGLNDQNVAVWEKINVTHAEDVYDPTRYTATVKVFSDQGRVEVTIPPLYTLGGIGSKIKVDVYTTLGRIDEDFSNYRLNEFISSFNPVDRERDFDSQSTPIERITKIVNIEGRVVDGKDRITFQQLKDAVIDNSIGDRRLPISISQLEFSASQANLRLIKDVDTITSRVFNLQYTIPDATDRFPISRLNMEMSEFSSTITDMVATGQVTAVSDFRYILKRNTLFLLEDGKIRLLSASEVDTIRSLDGGLLLDLVNTKRHLALFYHYILDITDDITELRAYDFTSPIIRSLDFKTFNSSGEIGLNSRAVNIYSDSEGFVIDVMANVRLYDSLIDISTEQSSPLGCFLMYRDGNQGSRFFIKGDQIDIVDGSPLFRFRLETDLEVGSDDTFRVKSYRDILNNESSIFIPIQSTLTLIYTQEQGPLQGLGSSLIEGTFIRDEYDAVITTEELTVEYGRRLQYLSTRIRSSTDVPLYQTYSEDVFLRYDRNIYTNDPTVGVPLPRPVVGNDCTVQNYLLHAKGDIVTETIDGEEVPIILHKAGDVILEDDGKPIPLKSQDIEKHMTLLFSDYRNVLCTNTFSVNYFQFVRSSLTALITERAPLINDELLENTEAFVILPSSIREVLVRVNGGKSRYIPAEQKLEVQVYVKNRVFFDDQARSDILYTIIETLDQAMTETTISVTGITSRLYELLSEFVESITLKGLAGENAEYIQVLSTQGSLTLSKRLLVEDDRSLNLTEDIVVDFIPVEQ